MTVLPIPRVPDPLGVKPLRWGVLGTGWVAQRFTDALRRRTNQRMVAVASRDITRAESFAGRLGVERAHGSYQDLVENPDVDVVYVATPHHCHYPDALLAIRAGKHTLVEKPFALDAAQASEIVAAARASGVFCMEALWTLFLPKYDVVRQVVGSGMLGTLHTALLDHGEWFDAGHRIMRPELAGGSLLDLGSYTVAVADDLLGPVEGVIASARPAPSGVEGQVSAIVTHRSGVQAMHHNTILADTPVSAVVAGAEGLLSMAPPFWGPGRITVHFHDDRADLVHDEPNVRHEGLFWQAVEVAAQIGAGKTESPRRTLDASVRCMAVLDEIRAAAGLAPAWSTRHASGTC